MDESRITIEPGKRFGQPCIRGLKITVWDVLGWLAAGRTADQMIEDYPESEKDDFRAVFEYAARVDRHSRAGYSRDGVPRRLGSGNVDSHTRDMTII